MTIQQSEYNYRTRLEKSSQGAVSKEDARNDASALRRRVRPHSRTKRPFRKLLEGVRSQAIHSLLNRAGLANRLAKTAETSRARHQLYAQKAQAVSRLLELGAGIVDECLVSRGLVTIALANSRCLHVPIDRLSPVARGIVRATLLQRFDDQHLHAGGAR